MLWLTWRQHRMQLIVTVALLAILGAALLWHGIRVADLAAGHPAGSDELADAIGDEYNGAYQVLNWLPVVPVLIGLFWGAPVLTREFEKGTNQLAWTQSVTRGRWVLVKLGSLTVAAALCGLALGAIISGWLGAFDGTRFAEPFADPAMFSSTGIAAGAWWGFTFVLGAAVGAVVRRMLPAMAVTIGLFVLVMFGFFTSRDLYAAPEPLPADAVPPVGSLIAQTNWTGPDGELGDGQSPPVCRAEPNDAYLGCLADAGYRQVLYVYTPDMYWRFQWTEAGLLALGAVVLGGVAVHRIARRPV